jgi:hypothetical protein
VVLADPPGPGRRRPGLRPDPASLGRWRTCAAVAAVRLSLESGPAWDEGHAHWRSASPGVLAARIFGGAVTGTAVWFSGPGTPAAAGALAGIVT